MNHFVQYHNMEKMGYAYEHEEGQPFTILTNTVGELVGETIGLIAREGRPRKYALVSRFIVDEVGEADHAYFRHFARGMTGKAFVPAIPANGLPWFEKIFSVTANFSHGLSRIDDDCVPEMEDLVRRA